MSEDQQPPRKRMHIETTPREAYLFVRKLASDRGFREEFLRHPENAMRDHGVHIPGFTPKHPVSLPPEAELWELVRWMERSKDYPIMTVMVPMAPSFSIYCIVGEPEGDAESE